MSDQRDMGCMRVSEISCEIPAFRMRSLAERWVTWYYWPVAHSRTKIYFSAYEPLVVLGGRSGSAAPSSASQGGAMAEAALAKSLDELIADQRAKSGNKKQV